MCDVQTVTEANQERERNKLLQRIAELEQKLAGYESNGAGKVPSREALADLVPNGALLSMRGDRVSMTYQQLKQFAANLLATSRDGADEKGSGS